jgi:hypothetical protein
VEDPPEGLTLDREDNDQGYNKENCRWADMPTQTRNRRSNRVYEGFGKTQVLEDWAREYSIGRSTLQARLDLGARLEDALLAPIQLRGESRRKLTEQQVAQVRRRHATGETGVSLSRAFGVSQNAISEVVNFKTYKSVKG